MPIKHHIWKFVDMHIQGKKYQYICYTRSCLQLQLPYIYFAKYNSQYCHVPVKKHGQQTVHMSHCTGTVVYIYRPTCYCTYYSKTTKCNVALILSQKKNNNFLWDKLSPVIKHRFLRFEENVNLNNFPRLDGLWVLVCPVILWTCGVSWPQQGRCAIVLYRQMLSLWQMLFPFDSVADDKPKR